MGTDRGPVPTCKAFVRMGERTQIMIVGMMWCRLQLKEKRLHGRRYWEIGIMLQKTDVWRSTKKKRERLKGVFIRAKSR